MATDIKNTIGLQKQFRPMPDSVYQKRLNNPEFGNSVHESKDYGAERFAQSLGVLGGALWNEALSREERQKNQAKLVQAEAMVAGKTANDLRNFDIMSTLQHAGGYDQTDNPYAIALLEKALGTQAANNAMEDYLTENDGKIPKSPQEAVSAYQGYLQKQREAMGDSLINKEAFDTGLNQANFENSFKISEVARKAIKQDRQATGQRLIATRYQKLMTNAGSISNTRYKQDMSTLVRESSLYFDTPQEASTYWAELFKENKEYFTDTTQLDALNDMEFFPGGHTFGKELPQGALRKGISVNTARALANSIITRIKRPDGTLDMTKALQLVDSEVGALKANATGGEWEIPSSGNPTADIALRKEAIAQGVPLNVAWAVFHIENRDNKEVIEGRQDSSVGAIGAMQLMPDTARELGITDPRDIGDNIRGGIKYLKSLYDKFGDWRLAALHYNCGPGGDIDNAETREYGKLYDEYIQQATKNPNYGKPLNPSVSPSEIIWEPGIKENFEAGQQAKWFGIVPQLLGKLKAAGAEETMITSAYRPPGVLDGIGAGSNSKHHIGDAMDIWVGEGLSREQGTQLAQTLAPYFDFVQFEKEGDAGATGDHVHVEGYNGGLEATNNSYDYNATAYNPALRNNVMKLIEQENADLERAYHQRNNDAKDKAYAILYSSELSWDDKKKQISSLSGLSAGDKARLNHSIDSAVVREQRAYASADKARTKAEKAALTPEQRWAEKQYDNGGYFRALNTKTSLEEKQKNGETLTEAEENKLNEANKTIIIVEERWNPDAYISLGWYGGRYIGPENAKFLSHAAQDAFTIGTGNGYDQEKMRQWFIDHGIPFDSATLDAGVPHTAPPEIDEDDSDNE